MTGVPSVPLPPDWDTIPGARGCTVEALSFKDHGTEIAKLGANVFGLSTQDTAYRQEAADWLHLTFPILSDANLELAQATRTIATTAVRTSYKERVFQMGGPLPSAASPIAIPKERR